MEIKVDYNANASFLGGGWVQVKSTHVATGCRYSMDILSPKLHDGVTLPYRVLRMGKAGKPSSAECILMRNAPKWVRRTMQEQLPIIKIMFS